MRPRALVAGALAAVAGRAIFVRLLLRKLEADVRRIGAGDYQGVLGNYADDFVLHFNEGEHRFAGDWIGREGMERFLQNFTNAGLQGEIRAIAVSGPVWALTIWVRFDDHADGPDGTRLYENRTVLVLKARWGKIVEQGDFYLDTARIVEFERRLDALGIAPVPKQT
jgi:ketosteroid isomerase-like protein